MDPAFVILRVVVITNISSPRYYRVHSGNRQVTAADDVEVTVLSENKKLADMNIGCVKVDAISDRASRLALFGDCGSL